MWVLEISHFPHCWLPEPREVLMKNQYSAFDGSHSIIIFWLRFRQKWPTDRALHFTKKDVLYLKLRKIDPTNTISLISLYFTLHSQHRIFCYLRFSSLLDQWMSRSLSSPWSSCASQGDLLGLYIKYTLYIWKSKEQDKQNDSLKEGNSSKIKGTHTDQYWATAVIYLIYILLRE